MTAPSDNRSPSEAAEQFLMAIKEGDPGAVWTSFSSGAKEFIISRGVRRGLPPELGNALLEETADVLDHVEFLADLLAGLAKDLERIDMDRVIVDPQPTELADGRVKVVFLEEFYVEVGPQLDPLPVGSLEMVRTAARWEVDRINPTPG